VYGPAGASPASGTVISPRGTPQHAAIPPASPPAPAREPSAAAHATTPVATAAPAPAAAAQPGTHGESRLSVGVNIKLKSSEITDCDVLVIEGHVEATVLSKAMEIAKPGTLKGTALIDIAEVHGEFAGELTARQRLIVHGTGRVSGVIRYGQLIVAEGGEVSGDVKRLDDADVQAPAARTPGTPPRPDKESDRMPH
jgi:cytoskeletal protein CcmA (bactofilin family)